MPDYKSCKHCGVLIPGDSLFCEKCGRSLEAEFPEPQAAPYQPPEEQPYEPQAAVPPPRAPSLPEAPLKPGRKLPSVRSLLSVVGIAVAIIIAASQLMSHSATPTLSATYESPAGFSIQYPSDWVKNEPQTGAVYVSFGLPTKNPAENLNVLVNASGNRTLSNVSDAAIAEVQRNYPDFAALDRGNTTLGGYPAYEILYTTFTNSGGRLKIMQIWTVKDGYLYALTYKGSSSTFDKYLGTAQQMIDSFQFTQHHLSYRSGQVPQHCSAALRLPADG
jgi:serine/threonine-protein kinase